MLLFCCLLLAGCAANVDAARRAPGKRIGVLSLLGEKPRFQEFGLTVFERKGYEEAAPEFRVDAALTEAILRGLLAANPGAQGVNLQSERNSVHLPPPGATEVFFAGPIRASTRGQAVEGSVRRLAAKNSLELVVLVFPVAFNQGSEGAPGTAGYGFFARSIFGDHRDIHAYANYAVATFDGHTGKSLSFEGGRTEKKVEGVKYRPSLAAYSPTERGALALVTQGMLAEAVLKRTHRMGLTPER